MEYQSQVLFSMYFALFCHFNIYLNTYHVIQLFLLFFFQNVHFSLTLHKYPFLRFTRNRSQILKMLINVIYTQFQAYITNTMISECPVFISM